MDIILLYAIPTDLREFARVMMPPTADRAACSGLELSSCMDAPTESDGSLIEGLAPQARHGARFGAPETPLSLQRLTHA